MDNNLSKLAEDAIDEASKGEWEKVLMTLDLRKQLEKLYARKRFDDEFPVAELNSPCPKFYSAKMPAHPNFKIQHILKELTELNDEDLSYVLSSIKEEIKCRDYMNDFNVPIKIVDYSTGPLTKGSNWKVGIDWGHDFAGKFIPLEVLSKQIEKLCKENNCSADTKEIFKNLIESEDYEELAKFYNLHFEDEFGKIETIDGKFFFVEE